MTTKPTRMKRAFDLVDKNLDKEPTTVARSGRLLLKAEDGTSVTLATSAGKLTAPGKRFFEKTNKSYNSRFDAEVPLVRKGAREYVVMRDGRQRLARTFKEGDHIYTKTGRSYFKARGTTEEYVLALPVKITGTGRNGRRYERFGSLPSTAIANLGPLRVPVGTIPEKEAWLKAKVLGAIDRANIIEVSSEKYAYHPDGAWSYSVLTTQVAQDGETTVKAVLDRPLQNARPFSYSHLPAGLDPRAFADSANDCVVFQLSRQFQIDEECIRQSFDQLQQELYREDDIYEGKSWRQLGPTARGLGGYTT